MAISGGSEQASLPSREQVINPAILQAGFRTRYNGREIYVKGIGPDARQIRNLLTALNLRTTSGRLVVAPVLLACVPLTYFDFKATLDTGSLVLSAKDPSRLPVETVGLIRSASRDRPFPLREVRYPKDYQRMAADLGLTAQDFFNTMTQTSQLLFAFEWIRPNIREYLARPRPKAGLRKLGLLLGENLATLHHAGLIAGDTHLEQFVIRGNITEVLRVDLGNIYSTNEVSIDNKKIEFNEIFRELSSASPLSAASFTTAYQKVEK